MLGYERVAVAIRELTTAPAIVGSFPTLPIGGDHRPEEVLLGRDHADRFHLLVERRGDTPPFTPFFGQMLPAEWVQIAADGDENYLDVTCIDAALMVTFSSLVSELLDRIDSSRESALDILRRVVDDWRRALATAGRPASREQLLGVFGELVVLERLAELSPSTALQTWRGREGYRHDFSRSNALEVKTYQSLGTPKVTIHGAHQLDPPADGTLHLLALRVEEHSSGRTIADMIDTIVSLGVGRAELLGRSSEESPILLDDELRLVVEEERLYVVDDDYPGIRASRLDASALKGIDMIRFTLFLDACPEPLSGAEFSRILEDL